MRGADRVAMPGLAVDAPAWVAIDRVVADQDDRVRRAEPADEQSSQGAAEVQARPGGAGEDALIVGAMAGGQSTERAEQVDDGVPALGEDRGGEQDDEAAERWPGERGGKRFEQRLGLGW